MFRLLLIMFALHTPAAHTACTRTVLTGFPITNGAPLVNGRRVPMAGAPTPWSGQVYADDHTRVVVRMPSVQGTRGRVCVKAQTDLRRARIRMWVRAKLAR